MVRDSIRQPEDSPLTDAEWSHLRQASRRWIVDLHAELVELRARIGQNSTNSSKPPSSDPPGLRRPPRPPSGRSPGGQPGHAGHSRPLVPIDRVNEVVDIFPAHCRCCGSRVSKKDTGDLEPLRHQVAEIPAIEPVVKEYRQHRVSCPQCGTVTVASLPEGTPTGDFGSNLRALLVVLSGRFRLSRREVVEFCQEVLGLSISVGSVDNICRQVGNALAAPVHQVGDHIRTAPVVYADESGWSERGVRHWIWVAVTAEATYFRIDRSRGSDVVREVLGPAFAGYLVSDRWSAYQVVPSERRQVCWSHLTRDLQGFIDRGGRGRWLGEEGVCLAGQLFSIWHRYEGEEISRGQMQRRMAKVEAVFLGLLEEGSTSSDKKVHGFCKKLLLLRSALFLFARVPGVEPTNNWGERQMRPAVLWRKGSFGTCSQDGSRFVERMMTVVMTCRTQGRSVLTYLQAVCAAMDRRRRIPVLLKIRPGPRKRLGAALRRQALRRRRVG